MSSTLSHCQSKLTRLKNTAEKAGLKINTDKTKSMRFKARSRTLMTVGSEEIENTNQFKYLGSVITSDGDSHKDISIRIGKAWGAYNKLRPIWRSNQLSKKTKLSVYRACVMSVLLYGCESWGMAKKFEDKLDKFQNKSLRHLLKIRWNMFVRNSEVRQIAHTEQISMIIKRRRWKWIGHILRMERSELARNALTWKPDGRRGVGRPKTTWRRMVEKERTQFGYNSWNAMARLANDRNAWRNLMSGPILPTERRN